MHRISWLDVAQQRFKAPVLALTLALGPMAAGCAPTSDSSGSAPSESEPTGDPTRGSLVLYTVRYEDATSENQYYLRSGNKELRLYFDKDPDLAPGTQLRVSGETWSDGLRVQSYQVDETVGVASQPLIMGMPYKARTFAFVLVDTGTGVNLTKAEAEKRLFGTNPGDRSVKQYYNEVSYGTQDITGQVFGPLTYRMTGCDTRGLATALKPMVGTFDHYLWYIGQRTSSCGWSGLAESGQPSRPTNDSWYNGSAGCVVLVQEPGHNFGMMHSSSMNCGTTAPFADNAEDACQHSEYGDRYDPMGGACNHMNAWQKVFEGWLQKCNAVRVRSSGTYTLQPLELACDGPQVLQIPMPKVRPFSRAGGGGMATTENIGYYYLELRTARGFDESIRTAPTVLVRVAEDFRSRMERGRHTWILDMDPSTRNSIDGMTAGKSFTDPAGGVSFQVMAISPDSATIQVTLPATMTGSSMCLDNSPYNAMAPATCAGLAGTPLGDGGINIGDAGVRADAAVVDVSPPRVEAFILVNADTDMDIGPVDDGAVLDLSTLPRNLTLRVETDPPMVGSVSFRIDGGMLRTDGTAPYSISSDGGRGNFMPWMLADGAHTVTAIPFTGADAGGREGEQLEIDFTLTRGGAAADGGVRDGGALGDGGAALPDSGTLVGFNPAVAGDGGFQDGSVLVAKEDDDGCACSVPGAGTGAAGTRRSLGFSLLALALLVRRRQRARRD